MSKKMDNDVYNGLYAQHIKSCATIIALRSQIDKQESQLQAYETQITLQEDGPSSLLERLERQKRDLDYYASEVERLKAVIADGLKYSSEVDTNNTILRARIEALVTDLRESDREYHKVAGKGLALEKERDELRTRLTAEQDAGHKAAARIVELEAVIYTTKECWDTALRERDSLREQLAIRESELQDALSAVKHLTQPAKPSVVKSTWQNVYANDTSMFLHSTRASVICSKAEGSVGYLRKDHMSDGTIVCSLETV